MPNLQFWQKLYPIKKLKMDEVTGYGKWENEEKRAAVRGREKAGMKDEKMMR